MLFLSFFHCQLFVRVAGAAAQDLATTLHSLPLPPSFYFQGQKASHSILDAQCSNKSM